MGLIVQKFGGTSVKDRDRIFNVARIVANTRNQGNDVVVVVSAQGDTTDDLITKAAEITSDPSHREMDMLLATGEQISISLLAMALQGTILSRLSIFGVKLNLLPACIICVALQEGQERGGVFALCASTVLALAGADFGYLSIAVLTFSAVFCAWLCRALFYHTLPSTALCCLGAWLVNETCIFLLRLLLGSVEPMQYLLVLLPCGNFSFIVFDMSITMTTAASGVP